jgi:tetratricopeptide (TPR) repeat protein
MMHPMVKPRVQASPALEGVYANLDALIRLQFQARGFSFLPRQPVHSLLAGRHASRLRGRGLNFEEIRRYLPGDDIRTMDWPITARTRKPHIRVYTEERDRPVLLVVDQRLSMFFGSQRAMKAVVAAEVTALASWRALSVGDRVGALVFDDQDIVEMAPHRSRGQVMRILQAVVAKNHALRVDASMQSRPALLNNVLDRVVRLAKHDYLVCLIGDATGADQDTVRLITLLGTHNDVLLVFIYDPLEARLPEAGRLVMAEGELQLEVNTSDHELRQQYAEAARRFRDPLWQGVALYRDGQFKEAAAAFARVASSEAVFDRGNALLMHGKYAEAIASYDKALQLRPGWPEARANRDLVEARRQKLAPPEDDAGGTGGQEQADAYVFDDRPQKPGDKKDVEVVAGESLSNEQVQALWLRRVQTRPADFLRAKFAYQYSRQHQEGKQP